ncbi:MAG TPA: TonB-dependent siderophore receptor [Cyanobacteria bacterium UBA11370]|nr:TonB-dependent siderophore receptor [Cyanobacteria bacterium UBA11370]
MKLQPLLSSLWLAGTVPLLMATPAMADAIQVTGVRVETTPNGLEVILETPGGGTPQVFTASYGETLIADIINTQLRLPEGQDFRQNDPVEGIASVTVTQQNANSIRVTVIGTAAVPTAEVTPSASGLVFSLTAPTPTAQTPSETTEGETDPSTPTLPGEEPEVPTETPEPPNNEIEVVITAEPEGGYRVPEATSATRTDTPIRDIPQSIQVVPEQVLEDRQVQRVEEALENVSGVQQTISSLNIATGLLIRGFDTNNIYRDGLRDPTNSLSGSEIANIERIEVLKGPASVLYGQGELGGLVNLVTKQPLRDPFYSVEGTIGNYDTYGGAIDLTGPLNDDRTLLYRFNASAQRSDTFIDFSEIERYLISPVLTWQIGRNTTLTFEADYQDRQYPEVPGLPAVGTVLSNPLGELPRDRFLGDPDFNFREIRSFRVGYRFEHYFNDDWLIRNSFKAAFQSLDSEFAFPIGLRDDNRTFDQVYAATDEPDDRDVYALDTNIVGRFQTGSIEHQVLFGFNFDSFRVFRDVFLAQLDPIDIFNPDYGRSPGDTFRRLNFKDRSESFGFYLQDQISLLENLKLVLGGRLDIVNQKRDDFVDSTTSEQDNDAFSPRVGIVYQPIEPISLYASFSRSFNPVETGTTLANGDIAEPERGTQYEVGIKADFLEGRLSSTLAFYELTRSNVLTPDRTNPFASIQTGEQRSRGIELDVAGEILPGWRVIASYAYTDAEITEDNQFEPGNRLINVPESSASLWTTYEIQQGSLKGLGFGLGFRFVGEREGDLENSFTLPNYFRTDAALYYKRNNLRVAVNLYNLFDIEYFEAAQFGRAGIFPGSPFTVLGTIGWEF